jgi:hypothetical protein
MCVMAALRTEAHANRSAAAQRAQFIVRPDTLPLSPATVHMAQTCGAQWTPANIPAIELPGLFRLALLAGQSDRAQATGARWTQQAGPQAFARGEAMLRQLQWVMNTRPRTQLQRQWVQQIYRAIDALGPDAAEQQVDALVNLRDLSGLLGNYSQQIEYAESIRSIVRKIPSAQHRTDFVEPMLNSVFTKEKAYFQSPFALSSPKLHVAIEQDLVRVKRDLDTVRLSDRLPFILPMTFDKFMYTQETSRNDSILFAMRLRPAPAVVAQRWYGRPDTTVSYPRHGVLTVLVQVHVCTEKDTSCRKTAATLHQLYAMFAPRGVDFILEASTTGSFGLSTMLSPAAEIDSLRTYFRDNLKLPGILAIQETRFTRLPDGRKAVVKSSPLYDGIVTSDGLLFVTIHSLLWHGEFLSTSGYEHVVTFLDNQLAMRAKSHSSS